MRAGLVMQQCNVSRSRARKRSARRLAATATAIDTTLEFLADEAATPEPEAPSAPPLEKTPAPEAADDLDIPLADWDDDDLTDDDPPFDAPEPDDEIFHYRRTDAADEEAPALELRTQAAAPAATAAATLRPAPAITLHVAWDTPAGATLAQTLAGNRLLARAEVSDDSGGLAAAAALFAKAQSPDVLILETTLAAPALLNGLARLSRVLDPATRVFIVGIVNDVALLRELEGRNICRYLLAPVAPDAMARHICELYEHGDNSRVIAVTGARGGAGASTVAHNLAWTIAEKLDLRVTLIELDFAFGAAAFTVNRSPAATLAEGLAAPGCINETLLEGIAFEQTGRLRVVAAPECIEKSLTPDPRALGALIRHARRISPFVVLDVPHQWNAWVRDVLTRADETVIVATPDLASLRNAKNLLDTLREARPPEREPMLVLNMTGASGRPEVSEKDFRQAADATPIAQFGFDPALFGGCAFNGRMIGEAAPHSKAAAMFEAFTWVLTGRRPMKRVLAKKKTRPLSAPAPEMAAEIVVPSAAPIEAAQKLPPTRSETETPRRRITDRPAPVERAAPAEHAASVEHAASAVLRKRDYRRLVVAANTLPHGRPGTVRAALLIAALVLAGALWAGHAANEAAAPAHPRIYSL